MTFMIILLILITFSLCDDGCLILHRYCKCDDICSIYEDCCPGHETFGKIGQSPHLFSCKSIESFVRTKIWIIDKCKSSNHNLSNYCLKKETQRNFLWKSFIPVASKHNLIYENIFCAKCNGETEFLYPKVSFKCPYDDITNEDLLDHFSQETPTCKINIQFSQDQIRICEDRIIQSCPDYFIDDSETIFKECKNGTYDLFEDENNNVYKNKHCCQCWNKNCEMNPLKYFRASGSFSYIFNFNEWDNSKTDVTTSENKSLQTNNSTVSFNMSSITFYNCYIFSVLSIISLSFLIILYIINHIFHNFSGYLTICLSFCMCLMNIITLLVTNTTIVQSNFCIPLAIIQHFMSISTFVWMSFYALDLLQTFGFKSFNVSKKKSLKTFGIYCIIGFGISSILVGTSTVIEFNMGDNSTIRPEYGGAHCWFTNKYGGIIWYFIPVCLMLMWNFGTCIVVFYRLVETSKECSVVQKRESNSTLWLCIRLTAVFGIGYFFQILVVLTKNDILILIGSTINCLQGFLLTTCFVCTQRVKMILTKALTSLSAVDSRFSQETKTDGKTIIEKA